MLLFPTVVDEQNAHIEALQDPQSPADFRKESEEEDKDNEKDEDTKELESQSCKPPSPFWYLILGTKSLPYRGEMD